MDDIIFGSTKKSLCTKFEGLMHKKFQMSSIGELTFFLGLQFMQRDDGIFINKDKYVADILKKFDFSLVKTASTLIETNKALLKDKEAVDMDVHLYRSMIGSLMYLTASRPDIMYAVCACARFQVTPKVSHLHVVKRIFRYLKGHPKLGFWYPKDSPFDLEAFTDSNYAGASLDRKSTTRGCQFLRKRLISWQCKKKTVVANLTTEADEASFGDKDNASKQGRMIDNIDQDVEITLVDDTQWKMNEEDMFGVNDLDVDEVVVDVSDITTAGIKVTTAATTPQIYKDELTLAQTLIEIKSTKPKAITTATGTRPKEKGIVMQEPSKTPSPKPIDSSQQPSKTKDKGKAKIIEPEKPLKRKEQIIIDEEKEETNIALVAKWDNTYTMMDAYCELVARLQEEKRGELSVKEKSRLFMELMDKRKKHFARLRAKKIRTKPPTKAQKRNLIVGEGSDKALEGSEKAQERTSKRAEDKLEQEDVKRQRIEEENESAELKRCLEIITKDDDDMFKNFNREDLKVLWSIIKARFKKTKPVDDMDNMLFQTFKTMFEHHVEYNIWKYQQATTKVLHWKLFDSCGVYYVTTQNMVYYLLVEKMYPFTRKFLHQMLNDVRLQVDYEVEMAYDLLRLIGRQINEGYIPE
nr:uncharacterized mitochondrial protein AtMg00810-like [Tanacetum cinerariifolium]